MSYATAIKIRRRLQALPAAAVDAVADDEIADVILDSDSVCNAYLSKGGYVVPVTGGVDALAIMANISSTLAAAYVVRDSFSGGGEAESPGLYKTLYDEAMSLLTALSEKKMTLPVEAEPVVTTLPEASAVYGMHSAMGQRSNIKDAPFWAEKPESYYNTGQSGYR